MEPKHTAETLKYLEKQNELLMESYRLVSHELHKLQVEEEMMMRKFYELMSAHQQTGKNGNNDNVSDNSENRNAGAMVVSTIGNENTDNVSDIGENRNAGAMVVSTTGMKNNTLKSVIR